MSFYNAVPSSFPTERRDLYLMRLAYFFFLFLIADVNPFPEQYEGDLHIDFEGEGDLLRQGVLILFFFAALPSIYLRKSQLALLLKTNLAFVLIIIWCCVSPLWALAPDISLRRVLGLLVVTAIALAIATLKPVQLFRILIYVTGTYMALDIVGVFALPSLYTMDGDGSWRGMHPQKNSAGAASSIAALVWLQYGLARRKYGSLLVSALCVIFLLMTQSKTSIALLLILVPIQLLIMIIMSGGDPWLKSLLKTILIILIIVVPTLYLSLKYCYPELMSEVTFTERTMIWDFVWQKYLQSPWLGYGYNSFWSIGAASPALMEGDPLYVAKYGEAHNGYLEVLSTLGVPGLILTVIFVVAPLWEFFNCDYRSISVFDKGALAIFYTITLFLICHNSMETSFLQGLNFYWEFALTGILVVRVFNLRAKLLNNEKGASDVYIDRYYDL